MSIETKAALPLQTLLSGADCFFLAMEGHYKRYGTSGNVCHLSITVAGIVTKSQLEARIEAIPLFHWLANCNLDRGGFMGLPKWLYTPSSTRVISISTIEATTSGIPKAILQKGYFLDDDQLCGFTIVRRENDLTEIVFSWHHIVMDAMGAETLLKLLGGEISQEKITFFPTKEKRINFFKAFYILHFAKEFIKKTSRKPIVQLVSKKPTYNPSLDYQVIQFSEEETILLDARAKQNGGGVSKGSFYLACVAKSLDKWLTLKGNSKGAFWVPVPQNRRPKGGYGPVISNLQAFMFYRIPREKLSILKECADYLTAQMFELIRNKRPDNYMVMSNLLRRLPSFFYYWLIKGPAGGSTASFLYSDPGTTTFTSFFGNAVIDITNYPPSTFPPGLTTIFERFNGKQKIIINHTSQLLNQDELNTLVYNLKKELLGNE